MEKIIVDKNVRIDIYLIEKLNLSRSKIQNLIKNKGILVNDKEVKNSFDSMFDLNKDGWLDAVEQGLQLSYIDRMAREMEEDDDDEPRMERALMDKLVY